MTSRHRKALVVVVIAVVVAQVASRLFSPLQAVVGLIYLQEQLLIFRILSHTTACPLIIPRLPQCFQSPPNTAHLVIKTSTRLNMPPTNTTLTTIFTVTRLVVVACSSPFSIITIINNSKPGRVKNRVLLQSTRVTKTHWLTSTRLYRYRPI